MGLTKILLLEYNQTLRKKLIEKFREQGPRLTDANINAYLDRFKELKHRFPSDKRDITKLNWKEVEGLVDSFVSTKAKLGEVKITTDANLVYDNGNGIRIFHGSDKESCIKYSTGYAFCIGSKKEDMNTHDSYRTLHGGASPYFIVNQNLPTTHLYHMSVVYVFVDHPNYYHVTNAKNDHDDEKEFKSRNGFKRFYEKQFNIKLDNKFVDVIKPVKLDVIKDIMKPIDKGSYILSEGDLDLSKLKLTSLEFFDKPWVVKGDFNCSKNQLSSLKGAPQKVGGKFVCSNNQVSSLVGAPQEVGGHFDCSKNQLTSLEGAPQEVGGGFDCSDNQLKTLEGSPQKIEADFYCFYNQLTSLKGAPQEVKGNFYCFNNQLTSLEGAPQEVEGDFNCSKNQLSSLKGAPQEVKGNFYCFNNQLTSLEGAPQNVKDNFSCSKNQLTSLEGAPKKVGGIFSCSENQLTSLEGAPKKVGGDFYYSKNPNLPKEEIDRYLRSIGKL